MSHTEEIYTIDLNRFDLRYERIRKPTQAAVKKMAQSLKTQGQLTPVIVSQAGSYILVDGFKRYHAATEIGLGCLKVIPINLNEKQAKAMMYLLNRSGSFSMIQEAILIRELVDVDGLTQSEASVLLSRHPSWISRRLDMIRRLSPEIIHDLALELIPPGSGPMLARILPCNQGDFSAAIRTHQLSPKEINRLADLFCKTSDPGIRQFILKSPKQALSSVHSALKSKTINWFRKIQTILTIIGLIENHLKEKNERIPQKTIQSFTRCIDQIKTSLSEMRSHIKQEAIIWDD